MGSCSLKAVRKGPTVFKPQKIARIHTTTTARSPPFPNKEKIMPKNNTNNSGNANKTKTSAMEYRIQSETDSDTTQITTTEIEDQDVQQAADAINVISLEEVQVSGSISTQYKPAKYKNKTDSKKSSGCYPQQKESNAMKKAKAMTQGTSGKSQYMVSAGASEDIMRSGHLEFGTLWASNDSQVGRQPMMVNVVNAPNNSTLQCGCENISCPFCNLMLNIERTDPSVLQ